MGAVKVDIETLQQDAHDVACAKGFWREDCGHHTNGTKLALIHTEVSEVLEAVRFAPEPRDLSVGPRSNKIPQFSEAEEELADVLLRVLDFARARHMRLFEAAQAKLDYNRTRPIMHGGKRF